MNDGRRSTREVEEPTLGALLERVVHTEPPVRFYQAAQLALPWSVYLAWLGWWRAAAITGAVGALGVWGMATRWVIAEHVHGWRLAAARVARWSSALLGSAAAIATLLEIFLRLMGRAPIS